MALSEAWQAWTAALDGRGPDSPLDIPLRWRLDLLWLSRGEPWIAMEPWARLIGLDHANELIAAGLVTVWWCDKHGEPLPFEVKVTLTPLAAELLGVALDQRGAAEVAGWVDAKETAEEEDRPNLMQRVEYTYHMPYPEMLVDPRPGPAELAEIADEPAVVVDEEGSPVLLWGREIPRGKARRVG